MTGLGAIGDVGQQVDWWFMYKVSGQSTAPPAQKIDGTEYIYFDAKMAKNAAAKVTYSKNEVTDKAGALYGTLCISLKDASVAQAIAKQMRVAHQPNVYSASAIPDKLKSALDDPRCQLIKNLVASGNTPIHSTVPFQSRAGQQFNSIAKNKYWGLDFYNDLVGPTLKEGLEVETWEHDPQPRAVSADKHAILAVSKVDLTKVGEPISWPNALDHAKLAISDQAQKDRRRYVCVGDINFTVPMRKRGGGTVAFLCPPLWSNLDEILIEKVPPSTTRKKGP